MSQQFAYFPLGGGLDLVTPAIAQKPGSAIGCLNYEPAANGYKRIEGFERFDGRTSPTDAPYWELDYDRGNGSFVAGEIVTGASSGAQGKVLTDGVIVSGTNATADAAGYMGLGEVSGVFFNGEALGASGSGNYLLEDGQDLLMEDNVTTIDLEGGVAKAHTVGSAQLNVAPDDATARAWQTAATANQRLLILKPPGEGSILGVWEYNGNIYTFRNAVGSLSAAMWKSTTAGWVQVALGYTIDFTSGGAYIVKEGDVITGDTSTKTATIMRVVTTSGSWSGGTAAGYFVVASASGAFTAAETVHVGANADVATLTADKAAITLPPGGRYDFDNYNFYGASKLKRMYGANGVGRAFEFDGTTFTPIRSGMADDRPFLVRAHKNHLWLFFPGGAFQNSSITSPLDWSAVTGAALYGMGDEITGVIPDNAGVLTVLAANKIANLYGSSVTDFQLVTLNQQAGALAYSAQLIGNPIYIDAVGFRNLTTSQAFGDFNIGTLSEKIQPLLQDLSSHRVVPVASFVSRKKNHYRVIYSDNSGICIRFGKKVPEILTFNWRKPITCIGSFEMSSGERIFFGSTDGYVYEADKGYSFDGSPIDFSLRLPFNHEGSPQTLKRWHKVTAECQAIPQATISVAGDFDYGDPFEVGTPGQDVTAQVFTVSGGGGLWDVSNWNQFYWSSATTGLMEAHLDGVGRNMSLLVAGSTSDEPPHLLQGLTLFFTVRGLQR